MLLLFGKNFTKFSIGGGLFLFDGLFFILVFICLIVLFSKRINLADVSKYRYVIFVNFIALLYLIGSLLNFYSLNTKGILTIQIILRQFVMFGYLIGFVIIKLALFSELDDKIKLLKFSINLSKSAFYVQIIYSVYNLAIGLRFGEEKYLYLSPLAILGVIVYTGYVAVYEDRINKRIAILVFCVLLSFTFGHSSAYLAVISVIFISVFSKFKEIFKLLVLLFSVIVFIFIFFSYQGFTDYNASWRMDVWDYVLKDVIGKNYGIFGNGFGVKYANDQMVYFLNEVKGYSGSFTNKETDQYTTSVHNSFLSIAFHIGLLPTLFFFLPVIWFIQSVFKGEKKVVKSKEKMFLGSSIVGLIVWCSFNVVLELPHSAIFFWVIYILLLDFKTLHNTNNTILQR